MDKNQTNSLEKKDFQPGNFGEKVEKFFFPDQPVGLVTIFFTEIWERFSYYGMRALMVLYMTKQMFYSDQDALDIYGAYNALVYATPLIGGVFADRILGQRQSIILGATLMMCGHFVLALPSDLTFFFALGFLIIGNGFFKPNMAPMINYLYDKNDPRREGGFTIFYMGVNIGSLAGTILCGWIGETIGWHYGFSLAGFGMLFGLLLFRRNQYLFDGKGDPPHPEDANERRYFGLSKIHLVWLGAFLSPAIFIFFLKTKGVMDSLLLGILAAAIIYLLINMIVHCNKIERQRLIVATVLIFFSVLFWSFFEQGGGSLTLFADRNIVKDFYGLFEWNASLTTAINAFFIIVLAPVFSKMWRRLAEKKKDPSSAVKFAIAMPLQGFGFYILALSPMFANDEAQVPLLFLVIGYFFITAGELSISPVGLGMVTKLSPAKIVTFMMGVWFLSTAFAHHVAAQIGKLTSAPDTSADADPFTSLAGYTNVFEMIFWVSLAAGILLFIFARPLKRMEHDEVA